MLLSTIRSTARTKVHVVALAAPKLVRVGVSLLVGLFTALVGLFTALVGLFIVSVFCC